MKLYGLVPYIYNVNRKRGTDNKSLSLGALIEQESSFVVHVLRCEAYMLTFQER